MQTYIGRLAPSPTGAQHLGNARTYIIAWLCARLNGGRLVLRIEDIDTPRTKPGADQQAIDDLKWLGLDWDEGPHVQTKRRHRYQHALQSLIELGLAYPCTCTRSDIQRAASAPHETRSASIAAASRQIVSETPLYPGTCATWQMGDPLPVDRTYCWRFRTRPAGEIIVHDQCLGVTRCDLHRDLGDFPITRKTQFPRGDHRGNSLNHPNADDPMTSPDAAYHLAVVVDDAEMGITHVIRGSDLIASAHRQSALFRALGYPVPKFAHVPLVVGTDGRRLAKRHGDTRLATFRELGVSPQAIVGWALRSVGILPGPIAGNEPISAAGALSALRDNGIEPSSLLANILSAPTIISPQEFLNPGDAIS